MLFRSIGIIKAHSALHRGFAAPFEFRSGARFERAPIFFADGEVELLWPGSFRRMEEEGVADRSRFTVAGSSSVIDLVEASWPAEMEEAAPDLTLRL